MSLKISLTLPESLVRKLEQEKELYSYFSLQEIIVDTLRNRFLRSAGTSKGSKRGRPKEEDPALIMTRSRIFSK